MNFLEIDLDKNPQLRPRILRKQSRVIFDVTDATHCAAYLTFLQTGRWLIQFEVELPLVSVPATIERKLAMKLATEVVRMNRNKTDESTASTSDKFSIKSLVKGLEGFLPKKQINLSLVQAD